jgi:hypothetical protein
MTTPLRRVWSEAERAILQRYLGTAAPLDYAAIRAALAAAGYSRTIKAVAMRVETYEDRQPPPARHQAGASARRDEQLLDQWSSRVFGSQDGDPLHGAQPAGSMVGEVAQ